MNSKKDTPFSLTSFFKIQAQTKHEYKSFQREIENNGCVIFKIETGTVKIYTPELALIFISGYLLARNMDTQKETYINGQDYLQTYIEAYKEGEQYFETEFKVSPDILYGANSEQYVGDIHLNFFHVQHTEINEGLDYLQTYIEAYKGGQQYFGNKSSILPNTIYGANAGLYQYVRDIHLNFFHVQHTEKNKGWGYVKKQYPIVLSHKEVKEFGYYSGIVNKVEEQVKKHPQLFAIFDKYKHNSPPQQTKTKSEGLKINQIALIHFYEGKQITRENGNETARQYNHNSGEKLFQKFTYFSSTANRKGRPTPCTLKKLKNKIELFESIVPHLTDTARQRANDEIQILKTIFESEYQ